MVCSSIIQLERVMPALAVAFLLRHLGPWEGRVVVAKQWVPRPVLHPQPPWQPTGAPLEDLVGLCLDEAFGNRFCYGVIIGLELG